VKRASKGLYGETWKPTALSGEVSVKLGWYFTL